MMPITTAARPCASRLWGGPMTTGPWRSSNRL
jgi:hypothetical protein